MAAALLVDTNVWLDAEYGDSKPGAASDLLKTARKADVRLGIASHSLKDIFYLVQRRIKIENQITGKISPEHCGKAARIAAWALVEKLVENVEVVGSDYSDAYLASKHRAIHDDYEDDLVIAAAMRMNADLLVTSDQTLLKHSPVAALSPEDAIHWLENR